MIKLFRSYSMLGSLLNESVIKFDPKFEEVLQLISSPISKSILDMMGRDIKTSVNFIGIDDNGDDMVSFSPDKSDTKDKYRVIDNRGFIDSGLYPMVKSELGISPIVPHIGDVVYRIRKISQEEIIRCYKSWVGVDSVWFKTEGGDDILILSRYIIDSLESIGFHYSRKQSIKIGRISRKMLDMIGKKFSDKEIEEFVNDFKSKVELIKNEFRNFELVSGSDIIHWYDGDNYSQRNSSTLQSSCMRYEKCSDYFGIYTDNENVKLLIQRSNDDPDTITGRAIVWHLDDGGFLMDRVYYSKDSERVLFIDYAKSNGWLYVGKNGIIMSGNSVFNDGVHVTLKNIEFSKYPYLDTLYYLDVKKRKLSNEEICEGGPIEFYTLYGTRGEPNLYNCGKCEDGKIECNDCNGTGRLVNDSGESSQCSVCSGYGYKYCNECYSD